MGEQLRARTVRPEDLTIVEVDRWNTLCESSAALRTPFLTATFVRMVGEIVPTVRVCIIENAGEPVAFFPFQFATAARRSLGYAERLAGELSDYFGIVAEPGFRIDHDQLLRLAGLHGILFTHLDATQNLFGLSGEQPDVGLRIDLPTGGSEYWEQRRAFDKRLVSDTERCWRRIEEKFGPLRFEFHAAERSTSVERLIELKRAQFARTAVPDVLADERSRKLLHRLSLSDAEACSGVMTTLYAGDRYAASHFGIRSWSTLHYWWPVYDPDLRAYSPGRLLLYAIIRDAAANGISRIDLGAGDTPAKRNFATSEQTYLRGFWRRNNAQAFAIQAYQSILWRVNRGSRVASVRKHASPAQ